MSDSTRRDFLTMGAALAAAAAVAPGAAAQAPEIGLKSELLLKMQADLEPPQAIGGTPHGNRSIFYAKGGWVDGPKVKGKVLAGGGDWFLMREDGIGELDVRATFETDDGALIFTHYRGVLNPRTGYFRTTPRFETSSDKYGWLNDVIAVGVGWQSAPNQVSYNVYHIL